MLPHARTNRQLPQATTLTARYPSIRERTVIVVAIYYIIHKFALQRHFLQQVSAVFIRVCTRSPRPQTYTHKLILRFFIQRVTFVAQFPDAAYCCLAESFSLSAINSSAVLTGNALKTSFKLENNRILSLRLVIQCKETNHWRWT